MTTEDCMHIFICTNQKLHGKCCADAGAESMYDYFKTELHRKKELLTYTQRVKVVKTSCLGWCTAGPNIFIAKENLWYTFSNKEDIDEIIDEHFIKGKKVARLINKAIYEPVRNTIGLNH